VNQRALNADLADTLATPVRRLRLSLKQLPLGKGREYSGSVAKLGKGSGLCDLAVDQHDNAIRLAHRAQPMRDDNPRYIEVAE
jgi:hypothetical protein